MNYIYNIVTISIIENERIAVIKSPRLNAYFLVGGGIENGESEKEGLDHCRKHIAVTKCIKHLG